MTVYLTFKATQSHGFNPATVVFPCVTSYQYLIVMYAQIIFKLIYDKRLQNKSDFEFDFSLNFHGRLKPSLLAQLEFPYMTSCLCLLVRPMNMNFYELTMVWLHHRASSFRPELYICDGSGITQRCHRLNLYTPYPVYHYRTL